MHNGRGLFRGSKTSEAIDLLLRACERAWIRVVVSYVALAFEPSRRLVSVIDSDRVSMGIQCSRSAEAVFEDWEKECRCRWMAN